MKKKLFLAKVLLFVTVFMCLSGDWRCWAIDDYPIVKVITEETLAEETLTVEETILFLPYNNNVELKFETREARKESEKWYTEEDLYWLSRIVSAEARGESQKGQIAVANVVLNRVNSTSYPNTIKEVIFQKGQFCPVRNGSVYAEPTEMAVESAILALEGEKVIADDVLFFYNHKVVSRGSWIGRREVHKQIGTHNFAK